MSVGNNQNLKTNQKGVKMRLTKQEIKIIRDIEKTGQAIFYKNIFGKYVRLDPERVIFFNEFSKGPIKIKGVNK